MAGRPGDVKEHPEASGAVQRWARTSQVVESATTGGIEPMLLSRGAFVGLAGVSFTTLALELVTVRLLSVLTWYHLAFFAICLAQLGMTAAGVYVFLRRRGSPRRLLAELAGACWLLALALPICHGILLQIRIPTHLTLEGSELAALLATAIAVATPFFFSGMAITLAVTRLPLPRGRLYAADLGGAAAGCLLGLALMSRLDPSSAVFALAGLAALFGVAFHCSGGAPPPRHGLMLAAVLFAAAIANAWFYPGLLSVRQMKGRPVASNLLADRWNSHSRVTAGRPRWGPPSLWGAGASLPRGGRWRQIPMHIDGAAFTACVEDPGPRGSLPELAYDVTSLPFHLRPGADVAVIGVGGGRDLRAALELGAKNVTGIEVNGLFVDLLRGELRSFAGLADRRDVRLVHDEARSYLSRTAERFDVIQMALIDSWASTAAGAMTLTESGLYTVEAWRVFLDRLKPGGLLAVSRWYAPRSLGETARMVSLAVAAVLDAGGDEPARHIVLASSGRVATLMVSAQPLAVSDRERLLEVATTLGFRLLAAPGLRPSETTLRRILAAPSPDALELASRDPVFDYSPPTDDRPYFFNMLKSLGTRRWLLTASEEGVRSGNLRATVTLNGLLCSVILLGAASIFVPLLVAQPLLGGRLARLAPALAYLALLGFSFMLIEVGLLQRFSVLLGRPIYSVALTLLAMIGASGVGSRLSDRLRLDRPALLAGVTLTAGVVALCGGRLAEAGVEARIGAPLLGRAAVVLGLVVPIGFFLGPCLPLGLRLAELRGRAALPWMWGVNGAAGVLGTVVAVFVSMNLGISWCLYAGAAGYLVATLPLIMLARRRAPT